MQRAKALQVFDQELKDAISEIKKDEYRREMEAAHNSATLDVIGSRVRADYQLTADDRIQLVSEIECAIALAA